MTQIFYSVLFSVSKELRFYPTISRGFFLKWSIFEYKIRKTFPNTQRARKILFLNNRGMKCKKKFLSEKCDFDRLWIGWLALLEETGRPRVRRWMLAGMPKGVTRGTLTTAKPAPPTDLASFPPASQRLPPPQVGSLFPLPLSRPASLSKKRPESPFFAQKTL